jgi:hypothetical protein
VSIAAVAAWRLDDGKGFEVEIDDGLEGCGGGGVAKAIGQGVAPSGVLSLQGDQLSDSVAPALWSGAPMCRGAAADHGGRLCRLMAGAIAGLALGVAKRVLALGFAASRHRLTSVT